MRRKKLDDADEDISLTFLQGTSTGTYSFTEITHHKPEKISPRIEGFVRSKPKAARRNKPKPRGKVRNG